jgi:hypothetical protein
VIDGVEVLAWLCSALANTVTFDELATAIGVPIPSASNSTGEVAVTF